MDEQLKALRAEVHAFAQNEIAPRAADIDQANDFPPDLWRKMGDAGLLGMRVGRDFGGRGKDCLAQVVTMEELSRASGSVGLSYAAHSNLCLDNLSDMYTALHASRAFVYDVARRFDHTRNMRKEAAACLMFASERAVEVALDYIQMLGARGYINQSPAGRLLRDAKVYDIGGGTSEIRRIIIGQELFDETSSFTTEGSTAKQANLG